MTSTNPSLQRDQRSKQTFTRLLAHYRARVYETYFSAGDTPTDPMNRFVPTPGGESIPTILVVEDNPDQWFLTRWALQQRFQKAHLHWLTESGAVLPYLDACHQTEMDLPRIVLVDLYLPSAQQGLRVLEAIKSHPVYKPLPTFTLSWSNKVEDITKVFTHSADGYLVKPTNYSDWSAELSVLDTYFSE
jgi:CheY-like chemotaxis protein